MPRSQSAPPLIRRVKCGTHRHPQQGCGQCRTAIDINLRLAHERRECGGQVYCTHCRLLGSAGMAA